jgi:arylsulfatase
MSLLPLLTGQLKTHHDTLYWSKGADGEWVVRLSDWKLRAVKGKMELFNLDDDPSETTNLANVNPEMVKMLSGAFDAWIEQMADPITGGN